MQTGNQISLQSTPKEVPPKSPTILRFLQILLAAEELRMAGHSDVHTDENNEGDKLHLEPETSSLDLLVVKGNIKKG